MEINNRANFDNGQEETHSRQKTRHALAQTDKPVLEQPDLVWPPAPRQMPPYPASPNPQEYQRADIHAQFDLAKPSKTLPQTSHFATLTEAQQFLVELYTAYIVDGDNLRTLRVKRGDLDISVVTNTTQIYQFMQNSQAFPQGSAQIDSIFHIGDLSYDWCRMDRKNFAQ